VPHLQPGFESAVAFGACEREPLRESGVRSVEDTLFVQDRAEDAEQLGA
jgi:hypothetical protein